MEINNSDAENIYPRARLISSPGVILRGKDLGIEKAGNGDRYGRSNFFNFDAGS